MRKVVLRQMFFREDPKILTIMATMMANIAMWINACLFFPAAV